MPNIKKEQQANKVELSKDELYYDTSEEQIKEYQFKDDLEIDEKKKEEEDSLCRLSKTCTQYVHLPSDKKKRIIHLSDIKAGNLQHYHQQHWTNNTWMDELLTETLTKVLQTKDITPSNPIRILDMGTGTGYLFQRIVKLLPENLAPRAIQLYGIDISKKMIKVAKAYPWPKEFEPTFLEADLFDMDHLNNLPEKFDLVMANHLFTYLTKEQAEELLKKITKRLKEVSSDGLSGGFVLAIDTIHPTVSEKEKASHSQATHETDMSPRQLHQRFERICDQSIDHIYQETTIKEMILKMTPNLVSLASGITRVPTDFELYCNIVPKPPNIIREAHITLIKDYQRDSPPTGLYPYYTNVTTFSGEPWEKLYFIHHEYYILAGLSGSPHASDL